MPPYRRTVTPEQRFCPLLFPVLKCLTMDLPKAHLVKITTNQTPDSQAIKSGDARLLPYSQFSQTRPPGAAK